MDLAWLQSGEFYSTVCALMWAVAVILFRKSGEHVPPVVLNFFKGSVGLLLFVLSMLVLGLDFFPAENGWRDWAVLLASGAIGIGIADSLFFEALNRLGAGRQAIIDCLYSPLVILCSFVYLREPLSVWLFVAVGLMAAAILIGTYEPRKGTARDGRGRREVAIGISLGIASMLLMAIGIVMAKPVLDRSGAWWATTARLFGGWALLAFQSALSRTHRRDVKRCFRPSGLWKVTVPAAFVGTYLSLIFWILGMKYTFTNIASVLNQTSSLFILLLAAPLLGEALTWRKSAAILIGMLGGVLATPAGARLLLGWTGLSIV
ncbi:MAG: DMT family transporter [Deltaproteobacteria bacterium]|nr:DMT family transporter [Deltaproteobacteria bacterium]